MCLLSLNLEIDVREALKSIRVPTLVSHGRPTASSARHTTTRVLLTSAALNWLRPRVHISVNTHARALTFFSEADSSSVAADSTSSSRGRPVVFSEEILGRASQYSYARQVQTRRGAQDLVYRMFAIAVLEHYSEAYPEKAESLAWLLWPKRRHALLTELGRVAQPRSDANGELQWGADDVSRLVQAAFELAEARPSTKAGVAMLREARRQTASNRHATDDWSAFCPRSA